MTDLISSDWQELDANNTNPSPNGVQGGYSPTTVAPIIRSIRGALKRFYVQTNAIYTSGGTGAAYTLTYGQAPAGYSKGIKYSFWAHADNTGACTLNLNSLGAKSILNQNGTALTAGQIKSGNMIEVVYNGTSFELVSFDSHDSIFTGNTSIAALVATTASAGSLTVSGAITANTLTASGAISAQSLSLTTPLAIASGGTGANTAAAARTNLGLAAIAASGSASDLTTGTIDDARLPVSMAGKTFTSNTTIDHATTADLRFELAGILAGRLYRDVGGGLVMRRYNETTGAAEGYIQITGNGVNDAKYNGNIMWHAGNDGSGSTLDADLLDGYHAADLYRDNADFTTTGNLTLSNGAPYIRLQDTTTSAYDGRLRLDANNLYIDGSSDGVNYAEVLRFELDTKVGYMSQLFLTTSGEAIRLAAPTAGQDPYISWYSGATRTGFIQYVDSGSKTGFFMTNDVSDDAIGIDNAGGTSSLRFWDNSRGALDVVLTSANIDAYDLAKYYIGSDANYTSFPLGSVVSCYTPTLPARNGAVSPCLNTADNYQYVYSGFGNAGTALIGTWRSRGILTSDRTIIQRVA
ncbi:hypothetical protein [Sinorhizobium psoraleae]|uniref:Uncharacterized protein n=1 Tax=Sinorhizobium psoraleae TaxID=520838 RepID=A0ABT4KAX6_9HYPH|nr:hypothetical protein [Sinorhizobium psoraleae]MCZ4089066.1 hypothetical protein [Sinorhizobium psoraleae]